MVERDPEGQFSFGKTQWPSGNGDDPNACRPRGMIGQPPGVTAVQYTGAATDVDAYRSPCIPLDPRR